MVWRAGTARHDNGIREGGMLKESAMNMEIHKEYAVEAAHRLPNLPSTHKCSRLHGHSFRIRLYVKGPVNPREGWIIDFGEIDRVFKPVFDLIDHNYLNEVEGLENPTSEVLANWIWQKVAPMLPSLSRVMIFATCTSGCEYTGSHG
jgi:6-pyruvoyltetrahydropterin/6-carboxytetrahydropterin synthase